MTAATPAAGWQAIRDEVKRRIHARDWKPGEPIPNEAELAEEFGCARATVNRALGTWKDLTAPRPVQRSGIPATGV